MTVCDSDMWCHTNSNPRFQKYKIQNERENKIKQSILFMILTNILAVEHGEW